jgi:TolA-binding protein
MRNALLALLMVLLSAPAFAQGMGERSRAKREITKIKTKDVESKDIKCEADGDCPQGQICDSVKGICVKAAMTLSDFEVAAIDKKFEEMQARKSDLRKQNIRQMEDLLATNPRYDRKADVYFRLAESYWEENHFQYLNARKTWLDALDKFDAGLLTERPREPVGDYGTSLEYYRKILREYPDYQRIDEVLYFLGRGALEVGRTNKDIQLQREGIKHFDNLIQGYPSSRLIPQSLLHQAEYYFENRSLYYAKTKYETIINNYPTASMYNYALYKLAWVYYNLSEFEKSVDTFHKVIEAIKSESSEQAKMSFRDQALNDLVLVYTEVDDGWKLALEYFTKEIGKDGAYVKLHKMAELYVGQDKQEEALAVYYHLIETFPLSRRVTEYYQVILDISQKSPNWDETERVVNEIMAFFIEGSNWANANKNDPEILDTAANMTEEAIFFVANYYHVEGDKQEKAGKTEVAGPLYVNAAKYYAIYLERFPNSNRSYEVSFWYAEILYFNLKDFKKAAEQYKLVIQKDLKGKFLEDAALGVIYCNEQLMVVEGLRSRADKGEVQVKQVKAEDMREEAMEIQRTDLHPLEQDFISAADKYTQLLLKAREDPDFVKKYPAKGEMIPNIMYIAAETFYKHGMFQEAVERFQNIFRYDEKHRFAAIAATMIMDCYYRVGNWDKVEEWARTLIATKNFLFKSKADLELIVATAMTRKAQDQETEGKTTASLETLSKLRREFAKNKEIMAYTTYTMAYLYAKNKELRKAIENYEDLIKKYPKSPKAVEAQYVIGQIYESQTQFEKAAEAFMAMNKFKGEPRVAGAIINAATLYEALKDHDKAIDALKTFNKSFPNDTRVSSALLKIGRLQQDKGDLDAAYAQYTDTAKKFSKNGNVVMEANARAAEVLFTKDRDVNRTKVLAHCKTILTVYDKSGDTSRKAPTRVFAAQAAFYQAEYDYADYVAFKLDTRNLYALSDSLEGKAKRHQKAEASFAMVINYKSRTWAAAAYYKIGLLYYEFAETLYAVPLPEGLSEDEIDEYKTSLEDFAAPVEEKARANFKEAIQMAHKMGVYSEWSRKSGTMAAKVTPQDFPVSEEPLVHADKIRDTLTSTSFIRSLRRGDTEVDFVSFAGSKGKEEAKPAETDELKEQSDDAEATETKAETKESK